MVSCKACFAFFSCPNTGSLTSCSALFRSNMHITRSLSLTPLCFLLCLCLFESASCVPASFNSTQCHTDREDTVLERRWEPKEVKWKTNGEQQTSCCVIHMDRLCRPGRTVWEETSLSGGGFSFGMTHPVLDCLGWQSVTRRQQFWSCWTTQHTLLVFLAEISETLHHNRACHLPWQFDASMFVCFLLHLAVWLHQKDRDRAAKGNDGWWLLF